MGHRYNPSKAFLNTATGHGCQKALFQIKIHNCVNFGVFCNRRCWHILWPLGLFCCICILLQFGNFYGYLV
jgi:hypothetical protein